MTTKTRNITEFIFRGTPLKAANYCSTEMRKKLGRGFCIIILRSSDKDLKREVKEYM
jgi:hypothetical protein